MRGPDIFGVWVTLLIKPQVAQLLFFQTHFQQNIYIYIYISHFSSIRSCYMKFLETIPDENPKKKSFVYTFNGRVVLRL